MSPLLTGFPFSTGVGNATISATTGSPTIDTTSRAGKTIYKFTGSGTITVANGGNAEVLIVGAGGGGGGTDSPGGGGGAGGLLYSASTYLAAGTLTITVGAGGAGGASAGNNGGSSQVGLLIGIGGGAGGGRGQSGSDTSNGTQGGSGGGAGYLGTGGAGEHPSHMQLVVLVEYQVLVMELLILAMVVKVIHRMYLHLQVAQAVQAM